MTRSGHCHKQVEHRLSVENGNRKKLDWSVARTTLLFFVVFFFAWVGTVLIAFGRAVLIPVLSIAVAAIVVQKLRGKAFALGSLGGGMATGGGHGLANLFAYDGQPIGAAELVPTDWTWLRLVLLMLLGAALFWYWGRRSRRTNVR